MAKKEKQEFIGTGRRKTAVASVRLFKGKGKIDVNGKKLEEYFPSTLTRKLIMMAIEKVASKENYDMIVRVSGGGLQAQAEAFRLGIARALVQENEDLRLTLKQDGLLTRDPRKKERKKYGLAGARKRYQFSKR